MAGDWLKWSKGLERKGEILEIAARTMTAPITAAGALMVIMAWLDDAVKEFDADGNANVTLRALQPSFVDKLCGIDGYADAMVEAGWLRYREGVLTFVNAERHNGKTAKSRALTRERVANLRDEKCNASSVTKSSLLFSDSEIGGEGGGDAAAAIYEAYPRKQAKQAALKAIRNVLKARADWRPRLLQAVQQYAAAVAKWAPADRQFIPHPATWFNRGSYEDDPTNWERASRPNGREIMA